MMRPETEKRGRGAAGIAAVLIGPGDIAQAHQPNEFIDPGQLDSCTAFLRRLIDWAAAEG